MNGIEIKKFITTIDKFPHELVSLEKTINEISSLYPFQVILFFMSACENLLFIRDKGLLSPSPFFLKWIEENIKNENIKFFQKLISKEEVLSWEMKELSDKPIHLLAAHLSSKSTLQAIHIARNQNICTIQQGWLFVGTDEPPSDEAKDLFEIISHHLSLLATIAQYKEETLLRDQFLSIASHELKTPLTSIYGILQLHERMLRPQGDHYPTPENQKQHSFLKIVLGQVERMNELIEGLLDVSRIQNGRFAIEPTQTDVVPILSEVVEFRLKGVAQKAGVRVKVESPKSLMAHVDPGRFEEVVSNLGMNAIRFSPEGGRVTIRLLENENKLILSVRDQGQSLSEEDQNQIFQIFGLANRSSRLGGLGLGLYISKQIAELHGGSIVLAESIPDKGNVIEATFPIHQ